tara:strand:+ start:2034 stop:3257 length:1224 start_codon:yes stop_codon:yes gene_type:complete
MAYIGKTPASAALTSSDISDGIITSSKIANGGVETVDIADANVTAAKLASGTVQNQSAFKNTIINGDMSIAQRATSATTLGHNSYNSIDRWSQNKTGTNAFTGERSTDSPDGFDYSYKISCTTAEASLSASSRMMPLTRVEDSNLGYLKFGTSSAVDLTMSFYIKSNKTGTYQVNLWHNNVSGFISATYAISSTNTWEKKTIVFKGDQGTAMGNDAGIALQLEFVLLGGSNYKGGTFVPNTTTTYPSYVANTRAANQGVNLADSTSNTWQITGLQLEVGSTASDFEFLPFDVNLKRCQRYFQKSYNVDVNPATSTSVGEQTIGGGSDGGGNISVMLTQHGEMRSAPTIVGYAGGTSGSWGVNRNGASGTGTFNTHRNGQHSTSAYAAIGAGWTVGWITGHFTMSSEL